MLMKLILIAGGGGLGALARYGLAGVVQKAAGGAFPWGTLVVNVVGCLAIGVLGAVFAGPHLVREEYRIFALVGLLGAFTTFSTFGWETFQLLDDGEYARAAANIVLSNGVGIAAVFFGYRLTQHFIGAGG